MSTDAMSLNVVRVLFGTSGCNPSIMQAVSHLSEPLMSNRGDNIIRIIRETKAPNGELVERLVYATLETFPETKDKIAFVQQLADKELDDYDDIQLRYREDDHKKIICFLCSLSTVLFTPQVSEDVATMSHAFTNLLTKDACAVSLERFAASYGDNSGQEIKKRLKAKITDSFDRGTGQLFLKALSQLEPRADTLLHESSVIGWLITETAHLAISRMDIVQKLRFLQARH